MYVSILIRPVMPSMSRSSMHVAPTVCRWGGFSGSNRTKHRNRNLNIYLNAGWNQALNLFPATQNLKVQLFLSDFRLSVSGSVEIFIVVQCLGCDARSKLVAPMSSAFA